MQVESLDTISEVDMVGSDVFFFYVFTSLCFTLAASLEYVSTDVEVNVLRVNQGQINRIRNFEIWMLLKKLKIMDFFHQCMCSSVCVVMGGG